HVLGLGLPHQPPQTGPPLTLTCDPAPPRPARRGGAPVPVPSFDQASTTWPVSPETTASRQARAVASVLPYSASVGGSASCFVSARDWSGGSAWAGLVGEGNIGARTALTRMPSGAHSAASARASSAVAALAGAARLPSLPPDWRTSVPPVSRSTG